MLEIYMYIVYVQCYIVVVSISDLVVLQSLNNLFTGRDKEGVGTVVLLMIKLHLGPRDIKLLQLMYKIKQHYV